MKAVNPPAMRRFGQGYIITWSQEVKGKVSNHERVTMDYQDAFSLYSTLICKHLLWPIQSFLKQQEYNVSVLKLGDESRQTPISKCLKSINNLLVFPSLYPGWLSVQISDRLIFELNSCRPGRTSKYKEHFEMLLNAMKAFAEQYKHLQGHTGQLVENGLNFQIA